MPYVPRKPRTTTYVKKGSKGVRKSVPVKAKAQIARVINSMSETKKHEVSLTEITLNSLTSPTSSNYHLLDLIPAGTTYASRIGHKIRAIGINIRGHVIATSGRQQYVKMAVLRIKDPSVDFLTQGLENNSGNLSVVGGMETIWRRMNTDAFEVLATRTLRLGQSTAAGNFNDNATKMFKLWVPFKRNVVYDATSATSPKFNRVAVCFWSADALNDTTGADLAEYSFESTYYFKDL